MITFRCLTAMALGVTLVACADANAPTPPDGAIRAGLALGLAAPSGVVGAATGGGHYDILGLDVQFSLSAVGHADGTASGQFHLTADEGEGLIADVSGAVTCLAVDLVHHRAWIGGVVTANRSTDPDLRTDIHEVGDDVWFRVLDSGEGGGVVDRTSFYGFKGAAGIETSAQYCAVKLWAPDNARTWPVTSGNISVR